MKKLVVLLKGVLMGLADVVPGVSGGTIALLLGIYEQFIEAVRSVNLRWVGPGVLWVATGFRRERLEAAREPFMAIHWGFLIPLAVGIVGAIGVGSRVIPELLDAHPEVMRGLFIGLVLASIVVPLRQMTTVTFREVALGLGVAGLTFVLLGASVAPPVTQLSVEARAEVSLRELTRLHPSAVDPVTVYCPGGALDNSALRAAIASASPAEGGRLDAICAELLAAGTDVARIGDIIVTNGMDVKATNPFNVVPVPAGTQVTLLRPALWYVFAVGVIAICAMVLPGISGSFLLLVLGAYYFVFSSIRGTIEILLGRGESLDALLYFSVFTAGTVVGITTFSRVMSWLFRSHRELTMAALIGLMVGSLRVLWPFKIGALHGGPVANVWPGPGAPVLAVVAATAGGFVLVLALAAAATRLDARLDAAPGQDAGADGAR